MIAPHRFLNLETSVIAIGAIVIKHLQKRGAVKFDELYALVSEGVTGESAKYMFLPAINFLYLLDKIEYNSQMDTFELKV
jgi:hypothetical protein